MVGVCLVLASIANLFLYSCEQGYPCWHIHFLVTDCVYLCGERHHEGSHAYGKD